MRWLIVQLGANGDCIYATSQLDRILAIDPGAEIDWLVSRSYAPILRTHPRIRGVLELDVPLKRRSERLTAWSVAEEECMRSFDAYDRIVQSQIWPNGFRKFDGTVRSSILRHFDEVERNEIRPFEPGDWSENSGSIFLDEEEVADVDEGLAEIEYEDYEHRILFECAPQSGQSAIHTGFAIEVASRLTKELDNCVVLLSTGEDLRGLPSRVHGGRRFSVRQNSELASRSTLMVGCGSGLSVLTSTLESRPHMVQFLSGDVSIFASLRAEQEYFSRNRNDILEFADPSVDAAHRLLSGICRSGFSVIRKRDERRVLLHLDYYFHLIEFMVLNRGRFLDAAESLAHAYLRYELDEIPRFYRRNVRHLLERDLRHGLASSRGQIDFTREILE